MHLAVKAAQDQMTTRSVRALLLKNASTKIKDIHGYYPIDFIEKEFDQSQPLMHDFSKELT